MTLSILLKRPTWPDSESGLFIKHVGNVLVQKYLSWALESFIISSDNETFDSNLVSYFETEAYSKYTETEK